VTEHAFSAVERRAVYRAIAERRDMRRFVPNATVPEDVLARLLHAAHAAPSVGLMQPWRFIRITDSGLRTRIHALVDEERLRTAEALGPRRHRPRVAFVGTVDLNADLGESFGVWQLGDDAAMLDVVTSANVACGFHAGDAATLARTCRAAAERGVRIGAQVSYRDLAGFGSRFIDATPEDLTADVIYQIGALQALAHVAGSTVSYVKPHGALYNTIVTNHDQARAVALAVHAVDPSLPVLGLSGSAFFAAAEELGLRTVPEAFADRAYRSDGQLVSRRLPNAVLHDVAEISDRVASMVTAGRVAAVDGSTIPVTVESVCVHGDTPSAVQIAHAVRDRLLADGVELKAFV
jgi:UPF0271 protein